MQTDNVLSGNHRDIRCRKENAATACNAKPSIYVRMERRTAVLVAM